MPINTSIRLDQLRLKINSYSKENLDDILHALLEAIALINRQGRCRLYLEDLTDGVLACAAATGPHAAALRVTTFPLTNADDLEAHAYLTRTGNRIDDLALLPDGGTEFARRFEIRATLLLPLIHLERGIGVLCLDSSHPGQLPAEPSLNLLQNFLTDVAPIVDQARKYHQQLVLARRVDQAKKKEAALIMVKSAVRLIDKLTLASVLIPSAGAEQESLQIVASYSKEREAALLYEDERLISLGPGKSLLSRYINRQGIITDNTLLHPLYFTDLPSESLQKRYLVEELGLKSLYVVPRYEPRTRKVICLVNYYMREAHLLTDFEKGLLEAHAEMAQRVIQEIGDEHIEIKVLAEINDLLKEKYDSLAPFLTRVLSKATELINADTGSIALVREEGGERWLVVEEADGTLLGAKSKAWLKRKIPPNRVGGLNLPPAERSMTGYVAFTGRPHLITDTQEEKRSDGFYREITEAIRSEIAVPVICDDEVIAVICLDSLRPHYFTDEHRRILMIIERMISRHLSDLQRIEQLTTEVNRLQKDVGYKDPKISSYILGNIIGKSARANEVVNFIQTIAPPLFNRIATWQQSGLQEATLGLPSILITGDTGSGKEFLFNNIFSRLNAIYQERINPRGELPVKKTNIAAYSGEITYSELFGHKRGAYTGAHTDRKGILEEAHGGVIFLDEIGDADPKTQVQLLRFLDNGGFVRLGENTTRYARVLLIAATNRDLKGLIQSGHFREDLYHRLNELTIQVPSLNDRREDIPDLAVHFLGKLYRVYKKPEERDEDGPTLNRGAQALLAAHHYTGNIRELRSILLRALFFRKGRSVSEDDIRSILTALDPPQSQMSRGSLTSDAAREIYQRIVKGESDFWSGIYEPYSANRITRDIVIEIIEIARAAGADTMPKSAELLRACDPRSEAAEEKKTFFRYKNFLYKTVRIA
jgi:transcriptional regulator with GAF, ATPase, and Fis domain